MKTLHVKRTSVTQLANNGWKTLPFQMTLKQIYIRCNKKGKVNFDKAPVYTSEELIERNNVKIIK